MNDFWNGTYYKKHGIFQEAAALSSLKGFPLTGTERILDIGCGTGNISKWMADRVSKGKVVGIDPSRQMLDQAIASYKEIPNLDFFCDRAETFQFDEPFDMVTSFHALHFVKNHREAFQHIKSALIPGGKILIRTGSRIHPTILEVLNREPWRSAFRIENKIFPLAPDQAESILQKLGFVTDHIEIDPTIHLFPTPKELNDWIMTWVSYPSEFTEDRALKLSKELTEHFCLKEQQYHNIPLQMNTLIIKAHLPT